MKSRFLRSVAVAAVLIVSLVGCGGGIGAANQNEPAGAVKSAFDAAQTGGFASLADHACTAQKDKIADLFGGEGLGSLAALGVTEDDVFGAVKMEFKDIQTTEKSKSGTNAVVHVTGSMVITLDPTKFRDLMKKALEAQGQTLTDVQLDAMLAPMAASMTQTQALDEDIPVVQEGGKWLICG